MEKLITILIFLISISANATTYYVATTGDDDGAGTIGDPFLTIAKGYSMTVAGDIVLVRAGTYGGNFGQDIMIWLGRAGSAGNPITLKSYPGETVIIDGENIDDDSHTTAIQIGAAYNVIDGLTITRAFKRGINVYASYSVVKNCYIHHNGNLGDMTWRGGQCGIIIGSTEHHNIIENNIITYNGRYTQSDNAIDHGIYEMGDNNTFRYNILTYNAAFGIQLAGGSTITGCNIYNNVFAFNFISGIIVWNAMDDVEIRNNIFYKNAEYGISSYQASGSGVWVDHNSFYMNGDGTYSLSPSGTYTISNNITSNPVFVSESDYHLQVTSPCINAGANVGLPYVGAAPDIGAYEYDDIPAVTSGYIFKNGKAVFKDNKIIKK